MSLLLVSDCIQEIVNRSSYVEQLLFSSACKGLLPYKPKDKLATDCLLLRVIEAGSGSLYAYYDTEDMKSVWDHVFNTAHIMAKLGKNLPYDSLCRFLNKAESTSALLDVILAFSITCRAEEEAVLVASAYKTKIMANMICGPIEAAISGMSDKRYEVLAPVLGLTPEGCRKDMNIWRCMNETYDALSIPKRGDEVYLKYAVMYGNTNFYVSFFTNCRSAFPFPIDVVIAFMTGNTEILKLIAERDETLFGLDWLRTWTAKNLTTKMVDLFGSLNISLKKDLILCKLPFWSKDQRDAVRALIKAGCLCTEDIRQAVQ